MPVEVRISGVGKGMCPLINREAEGMWVTFGDGSFTDVFLSFKGFQQILRLKFPAGASAPAEVAARPTAAGEVQR